ncbi:MAG: UDP-N-acetylmuramoyl-L-alanine--D-glutamate ligase [bacterium]
MNNYKDYFKGKNVTMIGLGLLGRGLNDAKFLAEAGVDLTVTDLKKAKDLATTLKKLEKFKNIKYVLGEHRLEDFANKDFILKAAGVPLNSPYITEAIKNNIPVEMDESLFTKLCRELYGNSVLVVGVTGTRGKTTTTYMIYELLKSEFGNHVHLGGNIKGLATLPLIKKVQPGDIVVMELSSWQLQGFGSAGISPEISVFTNFLPDHLNYYMTDGASETVGMQRYFDDKAKIFSNQTDENFLILGDGIKKVITERYFGKPLAQVLLPKISEFETWKPKIPGEHNLWHMAQAVEVGRIFGINEKKIKKVLENFGGVEGRMEFLGLVRGVEFYNDTTATTPEALEVALRSLKDHVKGKGKLITISGGADKKLDNQQAAKHIIKYADYAFLLAGTGTETIKEAVLKKFGDKSCVYDSLKTAVTKALLVAKKGDVIVLSPGFASFGMFKNEFDRGEQFVKLVKKFK